MPRRRLFANLKVAAGCNFHPAGARALRANPSNEGFRLEINKGPEIERSVMVDLKPLHLKKVKSILAGHVPEYDVLIYGSRANGSSKPRSYLDLAVLTAAPLVPQRLEKLTTAFAEAGLPFGVDTVDWAATGKDFRKEIKKTGVLLRRSSKK